MNSAANIRKRLLSLLPVAAFKQLNLPGIKQKSEFIDHLSSAYTPDEVYTLVADSFPMMKQQVFVRSVIGTPSFPTHFQGQQIEKEIISNQISEYSATIFLKLKIQVQIADLNSSSVESKEIRYSWPARVELAGGILRVSIVIIDRDLRLQLGSNIRVLSALRTPSENEVFEWIKSQFGQSLLLPPIDLTKGTKYLWRNHDVDSPYFGFKKTKSSSTEVMDKGKFLKRDEPSEFQYVMTRPLFNTLLESMDPKSKTFPRSFEIDPTKGELRFNVYPPSTTALDHVLDTILSNN